MNPRTVLFTFDYELFLGLRSGTPSDCILEPTATLLLLLNRHGFKGIFFVDTVYLMRLQEMAVLHQKAASDLAAINRQLTEIAAGGHYIFPHIHAHWLDADYDPEINEWKLQNLRYYTFSAVPEQQRELLFRQSMQLIGAASCRVAGYKVDAYRAGGWTIQPFGDFRPLFIEYGIKHEFSVIPGRYLVSNAHAFDFRDAPAGSTVYSFEDDPALVTPGGRFTEWAISTLTLNNRERWINFKVNGLLQRLGKGRPRHGSTVALTISAEGDIYSGAGFSRTVASFEGLNPLTLSRYLSAIRNSSYFHFISHPKLISAFEFQMIGKLLKTLKKEGGIETDFRRTNKEYQ